MNPTQNNQNSALNRPEHKTFKVNPTFNENKLRHCDTTRAVIQPDAGLEYKVCEALGIDIIAHTTK